jgi:ABC-type lipoprotein export system ATPase subunit
MTAVSLRKVGKTYDGAGAAAYAALEDIDFDIESNDFLLITGRSGCGKTTLLNVATGMARPTSGSVIVDGVDLWGLSDADRTRLRNRTMGFVFQSPSLLPGLSVEQNVTLPLEFTREPHPDAQERGREVLELVGMAHRLAAYPRQLSAGQQQRVVIARALINRPTLLIADEPTSDLDEETEAEIMALFSKIHAERALTVVMVTHARQLVSFGTRHVEMTDGVLHESAEHARTAGVPPSPAPLSSPERESGSADAT